ncbi:MAG: NosD domain-containing protein [Thermoplasmata archaeon]
MAGSDVSDYNLCGINITSLSNNNRIINNNIRPGRDASNVFPGIGIYLSKSCYFSGNRLYNSSILISGEELYHWVTHEIATDNTANGRPIYYYKNQNGVQVPADAGTVILANCSNMIISGLNITNITAGILLGFSSNNTIQNISISGNTYGILLSWSCGNTISENTASDNLYGVYLYRSLNNTVSGNKVISNTENGIFLLSSYNNTLSHNNISGSMKDGIKLVRFSSNNTITFNTITKNAEYGVSIHDASYYNCIYLNNFIGNNNRSCQAFDSGRYNSWNLTLSQEGNYWNDWDGQDWGTASAYPIDGGKGSDRNPADWYPLDKPVGNSGKNENSVFPASIFGVLVVLAGAIYALILREKEARCC